MSAKANVGASGRMPFLLLGGVKMATWTFPCVGLVALSYTPAQQQISSGWLCLFVRRVSLCHRRGCACQSSA